jgi:hypothetical protein
MTYIRGRRKLNEASAVMASGTAARAARRAKGPHRWTLGDIVRLVGWGCIFTAGVLIFPAVGAGTGESHEPGSDTSRWLSLENGFLVAMLVVAGIGLVFVAVSRFVPSSE